MITIVLAGAFGLLGTLFGTRVAIRILVRRKYGQLIRDDGPDSHHLKRGTPTMGGVVIILSVVAAYTLSHLITQTSPKISGLLILFLLVGLGLVGFLDDWIKISKQRSLGLRSKAKLAGQILVGLSFAILSFQFPGSRSGPDYYEQFGGITPASPAISLLRDVPPLVLPVFLAIGWLMLLVAASSNAVNITDGLDGLAAGAAVMVFGAYALINIWQYNQSCAQIARAGPKCYEVRDPHDLAVVAIALAGSCFGFLWWNCQPAKIFMGDTGSLALGGAIAGLAIYTRTELLLVVMGGIFVINTLSVILQLSYFRISGGQRLFPMAPLHHTFELRGWSEGTVVIRFWIIAGLFVAISLAVFYAEWVSGT